MPIETRTACSFSLSRTVACGATNMKLRSPRADQKARRWAANPPLTKIAAATTSQNASRQLRISWNAAIRSAISLGTPGAASQMAFARSRSMSSREATIDDISPSPEAGGATAATDGEGSAAGAWAGAAWGLAQLRRQLVRDVGPARLVVGDLDDHPDRRRGGFRGVRRQWHPGEKDRHEEEYDQTAHDALGSTHDAVRRKLPIAGFQPSDRAPTGMSGTCGAALAGRCPVTRGSSATSTITA